MTGISDKNDRIKRQVQAKLSRFPIILSDYYYFLINEGKSYSTAKGYIDSIIQFLEYTFPGKIPSDFYRSVSHNDIMDFLGNKQSDAIVENEDCICGAAKARNWSALKSFFSYLTPQYIHDNPVNSVKRPIVPKTSELTYLTPVEINILFSNVQKLANFRMKKRDIAIMALGFYCGLTCSSIIQIDIEDIYWTDSYIKLHQKNNTIHVPLNRKLKFILSDWLKDREMYYEPNETDALFVSQERNRLSARAVADLIKKYSVDINKNITPQVMRNSCIINLYKSTGDINLCRKYLNHADISTTARYINRLISNKEQEDALNIIDLAYSNSAQLIGLMGENGNIFEKVKIDDRALFGWDE